MCRPDVNKWWLVAAASIAEIKLWFQKCSVVQIRDIIAHSAPHTFKSGWLNFAYYNENEEFKKQT